jgi:hypothetical protein
MKTDQSKVNKRKKNRFIRQATPVDPENCLNAFEDKASYTTTEIARAVGIKIYNEMGMPTHLSCPIPLKLEGRMHLSFFLYKTSGIQDNNFLKPPFCRVISPIDSYKEIQFLISKPQAFNIDSPSDTPLVDLDLTPRFRPYKGYSSSESNFLTWKDPLYELMDKILLLYSCEKNQLAKNDKKSVQEYLEIFSCLIEPSFLPAYRSLNSHFFDWLEVVIGQKIDPLLVYP